MEGIAQAFWQKRPQLVWAAGETSALPEAFVEAGKKPHQRRFGSNDFSLQESIIRAAGDNLVDFLIKNGFEDLWK